MARRHTDGGPASIAAGGSGSHLRVATSSTTSAGGPGAGRSGAVTGKQQPVRVVEDVDDGDDQNNAAAAFIQRSRAAWEALGVTVPTEQAGARAAVAGSQTPRQFTAKKPSAVSRAASAGAARRLSASSSGGSGYATQHKLNGNVSGTSRAGAGAGAGAGAEAGAGAASTVDGTVGTNGHMDLKATAAERYQKHPTHFNGTSMSATVGASTSSMAGPGGGGGGGSYSAPISSLGNRTWWRGTVVGSCPTEMDAPTHVLPLPFPVPALLVSESVAGRMRVLFPSTNTVLPVGSTPWLHPSGACLVDGGSAVAVCDAGHHRIRVLQFPGATPAPPPAAQCLVPHLRTKSLPTRPGASRTADPSQLMENVVELILAGTGLAGHADGQVSRAQFKHPTGVVTALDGSLLIADSGNHVIRRIGRKPGREGLFVSTIAGVPGSAGHADGAGHSALFSNPSGLTVDAAGVVFIADTGNHMIRALLPSSDHFHDRTAPSTQWHVMTVAGSAGKGFVDGPVQSAMLKSPCSVTMDADGLLIIADVGNHAIRAIGPSPTQVGRPTAVSRVIKGKKDKTTTPKQQLLASLVPQSMSQATVKRLSHASSTSMDDTMTADAEAEPAPTEAKESDDLFQESVSSAHASAALNVEDMHYAVPEVKYRYSFMRTLAGPHASVSAEGDASVMLGTSNRAISDGASAISDMHDDARPNEQFHDGPAPTSRFYKPRCVAYNPADACVYVADNGNNLVRICISVSALAVGPQFLSHIAHRTAAEAAASMAAAAESEKRAAAPVSVVDDVLSVVDSTSTISIPASQDMPRYMRPINHPKVSITPKSARSSHGTAAGADGRPLPWGRSPSKRPAEAQQPAQELSSAALLATARAIGRGTYGSRSRDSDSVTTEVVGGFHLTPEHPMYYTHSVSNPLDTSVSRNIVQAFHPSFRQRSASASRGTSRSAPRSPSAAGSSMTHTPKALFEALVPTPTQAWGAVETKLDDSTNLSASRNSLLKGSPSAPGPVLPLSPAAPAAVPPVLRPVPDADMASLTVQMNIGRTSTRSGAQAKAPAVDAILQAQRLEIARGGVPVVAEGSEAALCTGSAVVPVDVLVARNQFLVGENLRLRKLLEKQSPGK